LPVAAHAQEPDPEQMRELMERSMELGQPGPAHEHLATLAGNWDINMTMWSQPGAEAVEVSGSSTSEMILGGRFLMQTTTIPEGMFAGESVAIIGFDRRSDEYTMIGLDTIGTYWVSSQGPMGDDGKAVLSGEDYDPIFGGTQEYDFILSWPDEDTMVTELIFKDEAHTGGGEPFKMLHIFARRR
jgi:hypothetical protein